jgi:transcriptional regulator with XRE-family HTH domain
MVSLVEKIILTRLPMKQIPSKIGLRLRELRHSRHQTQESLATECRQRGFAITRTKLAKYEIGMTQVPARFIPIIAHVLKADITDLLPPIWRGRPPEFQT